MVKRDRRSAIRRHVSRGLVGLSRAPKIALELSLLFILLLVVFAPNISQLMAGIAPLIPAPRAAFVYPLWASSDVYNLTLIAGQAFDVMTSSEYDASVWGNFGIQMHSDKFIIQLGIEPVVFVPAAELSWSDNIVTPPSPATYDDSQNYTFSIRWIGESDNMVLDITHDGSTTSYNFASGIVRNGEYYSITLPALQVGDYTYQWTSEKSGNIISTPVWDYVINKISTPVALTLDGHETDWSVMLGTLVSIDATIMDNRALENFPIVLSANFSGTMADIDLGLGVVNYVLNTSDVNQLPFGIGTYAVTATVGGNDTWAANSTTHYLTITTIAFSDPTTDPTSGSTYALRPYTFEINCNGGLVSTALFEFDGENMSATKTGDICKFETSNLNAGVHIYRWWASDFVGNWYSSDIYRYDIAKANATLELLIDGQPKSKLANIGDDPAFGASINVSGKTATLLLKSPSGIKTEVNYVDSVSTTLSALLGNTLNETGYWQVATNLTGDTTYNDVFVRRYIAVNMTDENAPQWYNVQQSSDNPAYGSVVDVWSEWMDDVLVDSIWLETNATGEWINSSYKYIGEPNGGESIRLYTSEMLPDSVIGWRYWANDTSGKINSTDILTFTVRSDSIDPTVSDQSQTEAIGNVTDGMIGVGDPIELSALCSDETMLKEAILATNESGTWADTIIEPLSVDSYLANFTWQNAFIGAGQPIGSAVAVSWKIYCKDYSDNVAETPEMTFIVKVIDPADLDGDGKISLEELTLQIDGWKRGEVSMSDIIRLIAAWKAGGY